MNKVLSWKKTEGWNTQNDAEGTVGRATNSAWGSWNLSRYWRVSATSLGRLWNKAFWAEKSGMSKIRSWELSIQHCSSSIRKVLCARGRRRQDGQSDWQCCLGPEKLKHVIYPGEVNSDKQNKKCCCRRRDYKSRDGSSCPMTDWKQARGNCVALAIRDLSQK